jgi:hypothetical protein
MKTREEIITSMCYTMRHDYGLERYREIDGVSYDNMCGLTDQERKDLWDSMAQIFDNDIAPYMEFKNAM